MKRNIILIALLSIMLLTLGFCAGGDKEITDKETEFDRYFEKDEELKMWNNVWVFEDKASDINMAVGILNVEITEYMTAEDEDVKDYLAVKFKIVNEEFPESAWGQDAITITVRQDTPNGQYRFKAVDGSGELADYQGNIYTPYRSLVPIILEKETYEAYIEQATDDELELLNELYEGEYPNRIHKLRYITMKTRHKDNEEYKSFLENQFQEVGNFMEIKSDADMEMFKEILKATTLDVWNSFGDERPSTLSDYTYDYDNYYIMKYDTNQYLLEDVYSGQFGEGGLEEDDRDKLQDFFYKVGYESGLTWTLYFPIEGYKEETDENGKKTKIEDGTTFDMNLPFHVVEACSTGCMNFRDVWINPEENMDYYNSIFKSEEDGEAPADNGMNNEEPVNNTTDNEEPVNNTTDNDAPADNGTDNEEPADNGMNNEEPADNGMNNEEPADNGTE